MTDMEQLEGFETGTLAPAAFGHREHLRVACLYLFRFGRDGATRRMHDGLRRFAARAGKPDKFDAELTAAWMALLADASAALGPAPTFDALLAARPDLLDRTAVGARR